MAGEADARAFHLTTRRKLLLTVLVVGVLCVVVEGASRLVWWRMERAALQTHYRRGEVVLNNDAINFMKLPDGVYGYIIKPGFKNDYNTVNGQGFRQAADVPAQRPPGSLRIVCLGESTTFGSDDEANYPRFLRRILETNASGFQSYEVINAGVPGWISDQVALRVHRQIAPLKPNAAILYVGWNDFQAYDPLGPPPSESSFTHWYGRTGWMEHASASRTVALLTAWVHRGNTVATTGSHAGAAQASINSPERRYRFLIENLTTIVSDLRSANPSIKIFVCTLVGRWPQGSADSWSTIVVPGWVQQHHFTPTEAAHFVDELNEQLRRFSHSHGTVLVDLATLFEPLDRTRLQWDFAHMYKDGYELMAWAMLDALRASDTLTARPGDRYRMLLSSYRRPSVDQAPSSLAR